MDGDSPTLAILYRLVYGRARDRLAKLYPQQSPEQIRSDPLGSLGPFDPVLTQHPEFMETVREAAEDAIAGRRPRW